MAACARASRWFSFSSAASCGRKPGGGGGTEDAEEDEDEKEEERDEDEVWVASAAAVIYSGSGHTCAAAPARKSATNGDVATEKSGRRAPDSEVHE